jgi:hypothetical protein
MDEAFKTGMDIVLHGNAIALHFTQPSFIWRKAMEGWIHLAVFFSRYLYPGFLLLVPAHICDALVKSGITFHASNRFKAYSFRLCPYNIDLAYFPYSFQCV